MTQKLTIDAIIQIIRSVQNIDAILAAEQPIEDQNIDLQLLKSFGIKDISLVIP